MQTIEQTMDMYDLVSTAFQACAAFGPGPVGAPVCITCGWLDTEHDAVGAEVHTFPERHAARVTPKRLAS